MTKTAVHTLCQWNKYKNSLLKELIFLHKFLYFFLEDPEHVLYEFVNRIIWPYNYINLVIQLPLSIFLFVYLLFISYFYLLVNLLFYKYCCSFGGIRWVLNLKLFS